MNQRASSIAEHILAGYPVVYVETDEPHRAQERLAAELAAMEIEPVSWDIENGIPGNDGTDTPTAPMDFLTANGKHQGKSTVIFAHQLSRFWEDPTVSQKIVNGAQIWKGTEQTLVVIGPAAPNFPPELKKLIQLLSFDLPTVDQRRDRLEKMIEQNSGTMKKKPTPEEIAGIIDGGSGLTLDEFENAVALSFTTRHKIDPAEVMAQKAQMVRKNSALEYYQPDNDRGLDNLAGLDNLKDFCRRSAKSGLSRGVLLLGVPGTGKSEFAKGLGSELKIPTIIMNIGQLFGSLVGESEQKTSSALRTIDAVAPCVLMIDEIEKGLAGSGSSGKTDSGVSSRVFGTFLTWLQEHKSPVYVIATCNDISALPPEFSRAERWDAVFFLDIPTPREKTAIFEMYREKFGLPKDTEEPAAIDYTGAEIRSLCRTAKMLEITPVQATKYVIPIAKSRSDMIESLRQWAQHRAVPATDAQIDDIQTARRKMRTLTAEPKKGK